MVRVEADPSARRQPGGPVVLEVDAEVARAMGFGHVRRVSGPSTEKSIAYEVLTEPQPSAND